MRKIKMACVKCRYKDPSHETIDVKLEKDSEGYVYVSAFSHNYCYDILYCCYGMPVRALPDQYDFSEGYICEDGTFVDRSTAMKIASEAGQLQSIYANGDCSELKSYMLKYD